MQSEEKLQAYRASHERLSQLESEITDLWGHINAADYRFLKLVAKFDRRNGYGRHGLGKHGPLAQLSMGHRGCGRQRSRR